MKQYVVINQSLGMSKGKIARMCVSAGTHNKKFMTIGQRFSWAAKGQIAVVLKTDKFDDLLVFLETNKIKHHVHVDAGLTQVEAGSKCSVTFCHNGNGYFDELKLY